jgi:hypothetical protein
VKPQQPAPRNAETGCCTQRREELLLVAALVTRLAKQLTVLLLGHALAALLDY